MNFSIGKAILVLGAIGISLAILNFILVSNVDKKKNASNSTVFEKLFSHTVMYFSELDIDERGDYRIQNNFIKATTEPRGVHDVVMVTHCTSNHLHYLLNMVEHWQGHISVGVLTPGLDIITTYKAIIGLHLCNKNIKERVTFHLVYPLSHPSFTNNLMNHVNEARRSLPRSCGQFMVGITSGSTGKTNYADVKIPYPNNLLRNVARRATKSAFLFVVDIDMMCNSDLYNNFLTFAKAKQLFTKSKDKIVYVVPAFESEDEVPVGTSKEALVKLWDTGKVQPFYYKACEKCQHPTNYYQWKRHKGESGKLEVSYVVEWVDPWEPFYIGPRDVPLYDERFQQYGFNRISQVCETHVAGYNFSVLDNGFLVHHGFKVKFHEDKDDENDHNRDLFREFKRELKRKYSGSKRRC